MNARQTYRITHWGEKGPWAERSFACADPRAGNLVVLGQLVSVVYLTKKGGDTGPTEYEHEFSEKRPPILAFNQGGLVICGGGYRVGVRGIHG